LIHQSIAGRMRCTMYAICTIWPVLWPKPNVAMGGFYLMGCVAALLRVRAACTRPLYSRRPCSDRVVDGRWLARGDTIARHRQPAHD
jgi:hypothetical protein